MENNLFGCTKCLSRHPFGELSIGHQLCKNCCGASSVMKCTYCRRAFQECFRGSTPVCRKCDANVKQFGIPSACHYCNIVAAFIGSKCQLCTNSEKKYGPPVTCEHCKQGCAFDRKGDSREKVDGKLLCWLCTLSYKRALAKVKRNSSSTHSSSISLSKATPHHSQNHKRPHSHSGNPGNLKQHNVNKKPRIEIDKSTNGTSLASDGTLLDPDMKKYGVALIELKDQVSSLKNQLLVKNQKMLVKDKEVSGLKAQHGVLERELRLKIQAMNKSHSKIVDDLQSKNRCLKKQVVSLTKLTKKSPKTDSPGRL